MLIEAYPEYIQGHIKRGHYEATISEDLYNQLKDNESALIDYILDNGDLLIDDTVVDDVGPIYDIQTF